MATTTTALEAARSVNALMSLGSGDQDALLEVLEDYFTSPGPERDDWEDDGDSDGAEELLQGNSTTHKSTLQQQTLKIILN